MPDTNRIHKAYVRDEVVQEVVGSHVHRDHRSRLARGPVPVIDRQVAEGRQRKRLGGSIAAKKRRGGDARDRPSRVGGVRRVSQGGSPSMRARTRMGCGAVIKVAAPEGRKEAALKTPKVEQMGWWKYE